MLNDFSDLPLPVDLMDVPEGAPDAETLAAEVEATAPDAADLTTRALHLLHAEPERWRIRDDDAAEWAGRHLAAVDAEIRTLDAKRDAFVDRIREWHDREVRGLQRQRSMFEAHLTEYALQQREDAGRKSIRLPSVVIETRAAGAPRADIEKGAAARAVLLEWVKQYHPEVIGWKPDLLISTLRTVVHIETFADGTMAVYDEDGCPVPGVVVVVPETSVSISPR